MTNNCKYQPPEMQLLNYLNFPLFVIDWCLRMLRIQLFNSAITEISKLDGPKFLLTGFTVSNVLYDSEIEANY